MPRHLITFLVLNLLTLLLAAPLLAQGGSSGFSVRWERDDEGARWMAPSVALGDHGAVLFAAREFVDPGLSLHAATTDEAIFEVALPDALQIRVDAAPEAQSLAAMIVAPAQTATGSQLIPELRFWVQGDDAPADWVYTFPPTHALQQDGMGVHLSQDGRRVVAWFTDLSANLVRVRVFRRDGTMVGKREIGPALGAALGSDGCINADATRLLIDVSNVPHLIDLESGLLLHQGDHHSMFGGLALSADGRRFASGDYNQVQVYEEDATGAWTLYRNYDFVGSRIGGPLALDGDGSHLAMTVQGHSPADWFQVRVRELEADVEIYRQEWKFAGSQGNVWASAVQMSEDAEVVAGSSWGDTQGQTPSAFAFRADGVLTAQLLTEGSGLGFDLDPSGQVMALGTKDAHVSSTGSGGDIICADTGPVELTVEGLPRAGRFIDLHLARYGTHGRLMASTRLDRHDTPYGISDLDLNQVVYDTGLHQFHMNGLTRSVRVPGHPSAIGQALHFQGAEVDIFHGGNFLSNRISLRVLP